MSALAGFLVSFGSFLFLAFSIYKLIFPSKKHVQKSHSTPSRNTPPSESELDSWASDTLKHIKRFVSALQQIQTTGSCIASPIAVEITKISDPVSLSITLTLSGIHTAPVHDLLLGSSILSALGGHQPLYVDSKFLGAWKNAPQEQWNELHKQFDKYCYDEINMILFGETKNYFTCNIDSYSLDASSYPYGDLTITCDFISLRRNTYHQDLVNITSILYANYPDISIQQTDRGLIISF